MELLSHGLIVSSGQAFLDEAAQKQIMSLEPYSTSSHAEINGDDGLYMTEPMS